MTMLHRFNFQIVIKRDMGHIYNQYLINFSEEYLYNKTYLKTLLLNEKMGTEELARTIWFKNPPLHLCEKIIKTKKNQSIETQLISTNMPIKNLKRYISLTSLQKNHTQFSQSIEYEDKLTFKALFKKELDITDCFKNDQLIKGFKAFIENGTTCCKKIEEIIYT